MQRRWREDEETAPEADGVGPTGAPYRRAEDGVNFPSPPKNTARRHDGHGQALPGRLAAWDFSRPSQMLQKPEYNFTDQQEAQVREKARHLERALQESHRGRVVEIDTGR